jgi:hypothetical protein
MPQSKVIILTDPVSDLSVKRNRVSLYPIQGEYSRDKLMLQRIRSYIVRSHCIHKIYINLFGLKIVTPSVPFYKPLYQFSYFNKSWHSVINVYTLCMIITRVMLTSAPGTLVKETKHK